MGAGTTGAYGGGQCTEIRARESRWFSLRFPVRAARRRATWRLRQGSLPSYSRFIRRRKNHDWDSDVKSAGTTEMVLRQGGTGAIIFYHLARSLAAGAGAETEEYAHDRRSAAVSRDQKRRRSARSGPGVRKDSADTGGACMQSGGDTVK